MDQHPGAAARGDADSVARQWFAVRSLFASPVESGGARIYEERITIWRARDFDEAMALAEDEAFDYARVVETDYLSDFGQSYLIGDTPTHAGEVFSLMRDSQLDPAAYIARFFETGDERTHQQIAQRQRDEQGDDHGDS